MLGDDALGERPRADARGTQPTAADFCAAVIFDKGLGDRKVYQKLALLAQDKGMQPKVSGGGAPRSPAKVGQT